jgi:hypothetical protein
MKKQWRNNVLFQLKLDKVINVINVIDQNHKNENEM